MNEKGPVITRDKIDCFISNEEFQKEPELVKFLFYRYKVAYLITELVIDKPQLCTPKEKRVYYTDYHLFSLPRSLPNGMIVHSSALTKLPGFKGTANYPRLMLEEIFFDYGEDGHVDNRLQGYCLRLEDEINSRLTFHSSNIDYDKHANNFKNMLLNLPYMGRDVTGK